MKLLCILFIAFISINAVSQTLTTVDQLVYDHVGFPFRSEGGFIAPWGAHEGSLHGLPEYFDWYQGARPKDWMDHGTNQAVSSWGQIFEWAGESSVTNVRFHLRNQKMYVYVNGQWELADNASNSIECHEYKEDYSFDYGKITGRDETNNGGGVSFNITPLRILHWWDSNNWPQRYSLPTNYEAIFITCEIRLIPDTDPYINLNNAKYLAGVSADYYPTTTTYDSSSRPGLSISRHKFLTSEWQTFTAYVSGPVPTSETEYRSEILSRSLPPSVTLSTMIGILDKKHEMLIYPNPANTQFTIEIQLTEKENTLIIYNLTGQELLKDQLKDNKTQIDISNLTKGVYFIKLVTNKTVNVRMIIKE
jgi:hypothetical protein